MTFFGEDKFTITDADDVGTDRLVYLLIFQQGGMMRQRVQRVCDSFNGKTFSLPNDGQASAETYKTELTEVAKRIITVGGMISMTKRELRSYLTRI